MEFIFSSAGKGYKSKYQRAKYLKWVSSLLFPLNLSPSVKVTVKSCSYSKTELTTCLKFRISFPIPLLFI